MIISGEMRLRSSACFTCLTLIGLLFCLSACSGQAWDDNKEKDIGGILKGVDRFRVFFVELVKLATGTGLYEQNADLTVERRAEINMSYMLGTTKRAMEEIMDRKRRAVEKLKEAAEKGISQYGRYREDITFDDVSYFNAKKVVIDSDLESMTPDYQASIKATINYLPTKPAWPFKPPMGRPQLNTNISTIHVPTNIYDKSMKILNGVQWSGVMTNQFVDNENKDSSLTWQYFCSSDGFFRIYPGMQWPRDADQVDTFDCRMRQWYIQAASTPKNIIILLDSSGSMKGLRYSIARSTVSTILDTLSNEDYFNVIQFSDEPKYVDECFNGTMMPASVDNIKRVQEKIEGLKPGKFANFEKALKLSFTLLAKELFEAKGVVCNKAIMLITDGAPDSFDFVFNFYNWPKKTNRVFTFLIGKEVPDNRQARWMACANKGKFAHISTRADVQENVHKYIKVLSRPMAIHYADHKVWSPVYLDYVTEKKEIDAIRGLPNQMNVEYESTHPFPGLGLIMSISLPVFDNRTKNQVGPKEDDPSRNLLGVVGADVRVNELLKLIPTFQLGVNGYAFAITNHGYILFHPDYKPFYIESTIGRRSLKPKPKYNSVEFTELEQIVSASTIKLKDHPLRQFILHATNGCLKTSMLTHMDNMKRASERVYTYQFKEVADTFRLVFVVPSAYGNLHIKSKEPKTVNKVLDSLNLDNSVKDLSPWIFCNSSDMNGLISMTWGLFVVNRNTIHRMCGKEIVDNIVIDLEMTSKYSQVWEGHKNYETSFNRTHYVKKYSQCDTDDQTDRLKCHYSAHASYGIDYIWIGTRSGLTAHLQVSAIPALSWSTKNINTIKNFYYKRAVEGWEHGYKYVVSGPVFYDQKEFDYNSTTLTVSVAEIVGLRGPLQVPAAVVAFSMKYSAFYDNFVDYAFDCKKGDSCAYTCNDSELLNCYLIDDNAYIMASNNLDYNGTGLLLGQHDRDIMQKLIDDGIFRGIQLTDYQSICASKVFSGQDNASNFIISPLHSIVKLFFWLISETVVFLSEWSLFSWRSPSYAEAVNTGSSVEYSPDEEECGSWIKHIQVRYIYCGFVVSATTGEKIGANYITQMRSCEQKMTRYTLDLAALKSRQSVQKPTIADCESQCERNLTSYHIHWLNNTNMIFLISDASCQCKPINLVEEPQIQEEEEEDEDLDSEYEFMEEEDDGYFTINPKEVLYNERMQCQKLRNLSEELKRYDKTRKEDAFCYDSTNEEDTPCDSSWPLSTNSFLCIVAIVFTVLLRHFL